ncbi:PH domain-containing protein [Evansella sp. AB-rgal1]|uniref:PH domain-containing protein n=1 Tax=Evansella sp. AB-rgal1 TaxID=3242696 RepID=UPI00359DFE47
MFMDVNFPEKRIAKELINVSIISETISNLIWYAILIVLFVLHSYFSWTTWIAWGLIGITVISVIFTIWGYIKPFFIYKNWRYDVDKEFLQLKSGALKEEHQLVPMTKIQAVATNQGPILRRYNLYSLTIDTMGSSHIIPALHKDVAVELRNQIASYAKVKEVE